MKKQENEFLFEGEYITVEEYPNGCIIHDKDKGSTVTVGALRDINLVISSLERLKKVWYNE